MDTRANLSKQHPRAYQTLLDMNKAAAEAASASGIDPRLVELIKIRASQINNCAYCLRMHTRDALRLGEQAERLAILSAWRESSGYFSAVERASLALAEAVVRIDDGGLDDGLYARVAEFLTPSQIAAVSWVANAIGVFNRVAIASRYPVEPS
ncbi:carboxymuconolactone decarboxylase family protein [Arthrobacter mobilis]|uniref:Carboxymuconolactone decarboxylase family protein n=1 Tax=Arthrobacter mobilis TaxID=2724944 RepID=A0A7X6K5Z6_9MICC|nr:carboxymuconolactone decarboxylase family protein [Arthrobacter mobilis]NKX54098.1 carboxymuconolactone decarboxylase family protein [Arthrobacter mobilis]